MDVDDSVSTSGNRKTLDCLRFDLKGGCLSEKVTENISAIQNTLEQIQSRIESCGLSSSSCYNEEDISPENLERLLGKISEEKECVKDFISPSDLDLIETLEMLRGLTDQLDSSQRATLFYRVKKVLNVTLPRYRFHLENTGLYTL